VTEGQILYAGKAQPALAICYLPEGDAQTEETVYLSFDRNEYGARMLADLRGSAAPAGLSAE
jgi:hypothetical protein